MTEEKVAERKELRERLLNELYEYHFSHNGKSKQVATEIKDSEIKLAYIYLEDKHLIDFDNFEHPVFAGVKINAYGIDEIEKQK